MKNILTSLILVFCVTTNGNTQTWQWFNTTGHDLSSDGVDGIVSGSQHFYFACHFERDVTFGGQNFTSIGIENKADIAIVKIDTNGEVIWAKQAGSINYDLVNGMWIDNDENIYITGRYNQLSDMGPFNLQNFGIESIFVAKLNSDGQWLWAVTCESNSNSSAVGEDIVVDDDGNVYVTGRIFGEAIFSFDTLQSNGLQYIFFGKINQLGV
ncbi:MAG: SBBP repeat-containing protein, partial [Bacteroidetes bacterium]|nr:SBBP repeat-containing protein [Bacteroidota bacterium]